MTTARVSSILTISVPREQFGWDRPLVRLCSNRNAATIEQYKLYINMDVSTAWTAHHVHHVDRKAQHTIGTKRVQYNLYNVDVSNKCPLLCELYAKYNM